MFNELIPYNLGVFNYNYGDKSGTWLFRCTWGDLDIINLYNTKGLLTAIKYCIYNNKKIICYESSEIIVANAPLISLQQPYMRGITKYRIRTKERFISLINLKSELIKDSCYYNSPNIVVNNKELCMFMPNQRGTFTYSNNMLIYDSDNIIFILPNDYYRHIDVQAYNKIFINFVTGEIAGRYAGLDSSNKNYLETEERWDAIKKRWVITKEKVTPIAGCKIK